MPHRFVVCDPNLCTGCELCEFACSAVKSGVFDLELSRIRLVRPNATVMMSISCRCCENAPCIIACPRDALTQNSNGVIELDKRRCSGCGWCIEACDFGAIVMDPSTKTVLICDLCLDLPQPRCVEVCPKKALSFSSPEGVAQDARKRALKQLAGEPQPSGDSA